MPRIDETRPFLAVNIAVLTVSDTRTAADDKSGQTLADLIVAGGYGHTRLGEWIFGGVTHELLTSSPVCCMLSH